MKLWEGFSQKPGMDYYIYAQFETLHLLKEFVDDVVITAINSFVTLLRNSRRPALGSIILNNISYLRLHLLLQLSDHNLPNLNPKSTEDRLNYNFRTRKSGVF